MPSTENATGPVTVEWRVWHYPQVGGGPAFYWPVPDLDTGIHLTNALAQYDLFQLEHRIKPDYASAGGVEYRHPVLTDGDWWGVDPDDADDVAETRAMTKGAVP